MILPSDPDRKWYTEAVHLYALIIAERMHFAQANYGDGEWGCLLGHEGENSQGEVYNPVLRDALRETLLQPVGQWCGVNPGEKLRAEVQAWVRDNGVRVKWLFKEILSAANVHGHLAPFLQAVRTRSVILVAPAHLADLPEHVIGRHRYVGVPDHTAWQVVDETFHAVLEVIQPDDLVLFASGMATNLSIYRLWPELQHTATLLDIGAILDPYVGVFSRKNYRPPEWQRDKMPLNLT